MYLCVLTVTCVCGTCSFELPFPTLFCVFCLAGNTSESWPLHITFTAIQVFNIYMTKGILEIENYWFWWLHKKKMCFITHWIWTFTTFITFYKIWQKDSDLYILVNMRSARVQLSVRLTWIDLLGLVHLDFKSSSLTSAQVKVLNRIIL